MDLQEANPKDFTLKDKTREILGVSGEKIYEQPKWTERRYKNSSREQRSAMNKTLSCLVEILGTDFSKNSGSFLNTNDIVCAACCVT